MTNRRYAGADGLLAAALSWHSGFLPSRPPAEPRTRRTGRQCPANCPESSRLADRRSLVVGDRAYAMGDETGLYPATGWHIRGEMGGIWTQPIKLLDGIWFGVDGAWLGKDVAGREVHQWPRLPADRLSGLTSGTSVPTSCPTVSARRSSD